MLMQETVYSSTPSTICVFPMISFASGSNFNKTARNSQSHFFCLIKVERTNIAKTLLNSCQLLDSYYNISHVCTDKLIIVVTFLWLIRVDFSIFVFISVNDWSWSYFFNLSTYLVAKLVYILQPFWKTLQHFGFSSKKLKTPCWLIFFGS